MKTLPKLGQLLVLALCCVLILFMAVELAHVHTGGSTDAAHCPLCVAAHTPFQAAIPLSAGLTLAVLWLVTSGHALAGVRLAGGTPRIRPPPAMSLSASICS